MMASRGQSETAKLKQNLEEQLDRLVLQMADLEESRDDLDPSEYEETKHETIEQLKEFKATLDRLTTGNMSLVDELNGLQLTIQAAIQAAFKTPEVIRMFAKKQPGLLIERLNDVRRDVKTGRLSGNSAIEQQAEILLALKKLGEHLSAEDEAFLVSHSGSSWSEFKAVAESGSASGDAVLQVAGSQVRKAQN